MKAALQGMLRPSRFRRATSLKDFKVLTSAAFFVGKTLKVCFLTHMTKGNHGNPRKMLQVHQGKNDSGTAGYGQHAELHADELPICKAVLTERVLRSNADGKIRDRRFAL